MKLGEMLLRDKRINEEQLQQVVERQASAGGRFGTVLAEMGLIDLDTLTVYLGLELGIPIASGATLERVKKTAVKLLSPRDAARFRCIPIVIQHRQLIAAIDDPHDLQALDELSQITSYRIVPRVAPEIRIYYYLERYYGVPRPQRFALLGDKPRGSRKRPSDPALPAPPLPGLPPVSETPTLAPTPAPPLRTRARNTEPPPPPPRARAVEIEAEDLVEVLEADDAATAEKAPELASTPQVAPTQPAKEPVPTYEVLDAAAAVAAMESATDRAAIARALMSYACGVFDLAALLVVRDNMAFGWQVHGGDADRIEALLMPLEMPSIFQMALHLGDHQYHGHAFPSTLHDYLFKVLRCQRPPFSLVSAVSIGDRIVNLLYGHRNEPMELSEHALAEIRQVCNAAGEAYVRLIELSKGRARARSQALGTQGPGAGTGAATKAPAPEAATDSVPASPAEAEPKAESAPTSEATSEAEPKVDSAPTSETTNEADAATTDESEKAVDETSEPSKDEPVAKGKKKKKRRRKR